MALDFIRRRNFLKVIIFAKLRSGNGIYAPKTQPKPNSPPSFPPPPPPLLPSYVYNWNDLYIFLNSSSGSPCSLIERRKTVQGLVIRKFSHPGLLWAKLIEKVAASTANWTIKDSEDLEL